MAGARRSTPSAGSKRGRDAKLNPSSEKPLFFSLDRARFSNIRTRLQVVCVVVPLAHLTSKQSVYDVVVKKVLHKPFASAGDVQKQQQEGITHATTAQSDTPLPSSATRVLAAPDMEDDLQQRPSTVLPDAPPKDVDLVVHVNKMEVQADSARQVNAAGDVQLNVLTSLTVATVHHGVIVGASSPSECTNCLSVLVPVDKDSHALTSSSSSGATPKRHRKETATTRKDTEAEQEAEGKEEAHDDGRAETSAVVGSTLTITVRCLEDEPVVPGQSVMVVSEPGGTIRCLAVRPPRRAPGPFFLVPGGDPKDPYHTPASHVRIECDIPKDNDDVEGAEGGKKKTKPMKKRE